MGICSSKSNSGAAAAAAATAAGPPTIPVVVPDTIAASPAIAQAAAGPVSRSPAPPAQPKPPSTAMAIGEQDRGRTIDQVEITVSKVPAGADAKGAQVRTLVDPGSLSISVRKVSDRYDVGRELGRGCFGVVKLCVERETQEQYALKVIMKSALKATLDVKAEVQQLKKVGHHPNVVELHDFFEDDIGNFYIVMELCTGGDLFNRIVKSGSYSECDASRLLNQLASAIKHMHEHSIAHRDLKPENLLLANDRVDSPLKVVDFGLSKVVAGPQAMMNTVIGTWAYCAPEVFSRRPYTDAVDNWALGVLQFIMLAGYHPFDIFGNSTEPQLIDKICKGKFDFNEPEWQFITQDAKDLIVALLQKDPKQRMSIDDYLKSDWVQGRTASTNRLDASQKRLQAHLSRVT